MSLYNYSKAKVDRSDEEKPLTRLTRNGFTAEIEFDLTKLRFVGTINHDDGVDVFYSQSHKKLKKAFRKTIRRIKQQAETMIQVRRQIFPLLGVIQSGEATISIDPNRTDQYIGAVIKTALRHSDGASFSVADETVQPQLKSQKQVGAKA